MKKNYKFVWGMFHPIVIVWDVENYETAANLVNLSSGKIEVYEQDSEKTFDANSMSFEKWKHFTTIYPDIRRMD